MRHIGRDFRHILEALLSAKISGETAHIYAWGDRATVKRCLHTMMGIAGLKLEYQSLITGVVAFCECVHRQPSQNIVFANGDTQTAT